MSYSYTVEKIGAAVHTLATEEGTLRERLNKASVDIGVAPRSELPEEMAHDLKKLQEGIVKLKLETTTATTQQLSSYADRLVAFSYQLRELHHKYEPGWFDGYIPLSD